MVIPNFVGIGAPKSGTTWLYKILKQHPQVFMPDKRKELDFFTMNYDRGLEWYESFFPSLEHKAIGEFSPMYFYGKNTKRTAKRISLCPSIQKLILILRNPVERIYSQYNHSIRAGQARKSFEDYIENTINIELSCYAPKLKNYLEFFSRDQLCCLIFEESVADIDNTKKKIANFLDILPQEFPTEVNYAEKVNASYLPKYPKLNYFASRTRKILLERDLDWILNGSKRLGLHKIFEVGSKSTIPSMSRETRLHLQDIFASDIEDLEKLLDINLDIWRT